MVLPDLAKELLSGKNFGTVATIMEDGSPQASVVWFDTDGEHVIFNTSEGRLKTDNMHREPRVAIAIHDAEMPYRQAMIRGRVVEITAEGADEHADRLAKKYLGLDKYPYLQPGEQRVIVKVAPERVGLIDHPVAG